LITRQYNLGTRILLIEEEAGVALVVSDLLRAEGHGMAIGTSESAFSPHFQTGANAEGLDFCVSINEPAIV
jgi:C4-dicarboxylate-specific signal transduction histidine kinase